MVNIAGVRFRTAGKVYFFDPGELKLHLGMNVIVETARGVEYGTVTGAVRPVSEDRLVAPLKKVIRIATKDDSRRYRENEEKRADAIRICREKIEKHKLEMKLIDAEYTFDGSKVIFYFTADGRVDFRNLVKDLASVFRMRIELRQIGVRDEAKMVGGIGNCGRCLCCNSWLSDFNPVSIKMAKAQNLSLNPSKISGVCGRLMCCLKYENEIYTELKKSMPEPGERVMTPEGLALVTDSNIFEGKVKVRLFKEERRGEEKEAAEKKGGRRKKGDEKPEKGAKGKKGADPGKEELLSDEIYSFDKSEIERIERKGKRKERDKKQSTEKELLAAVTPEERAELEALIDGEME